jgi:hypothetical protein
VPWKEIYIPIWEYVNHEFLDFLFCTANTVYFGTNSKRVVPHPCVGEVAGTKTFDDGGNFVVEAIRLKIAELQLA